MRQSTPSVKGSLILSSVALCVATVAMPTNTTQPSCYDLMLKVPVVATNYDLGLKRVDNNIEASMYAVDLDRWDFPNATEVILGDINITDSFSIYAQLCFPKPEKDKNVMQILTHGGIFDHRYWDAQIDPAQYSWVLAATEAGYTVLNYDRLGNGLSQKPDAYTVSQAPVEVEILHSLTKMVREGSLLSALEAGYVYSPTLHLAPFENIVHVGHSYGSQTTAGFLTKYGSESSGAVLTGFTFPVHGQFSAVVFGVEFAASNSPALLGQFGSGYLVTATVSNLQNCFFHRFNESDPTGFSDAALAYADGVKQPISAGEAMSLRLKLFGTGPSPEFTGPIQFVTGEFDFLVCEGDCKHNFDPAVSAEVYPNAAAVERYIHAGAGHGLTLHRNARAGYEKSFEFLARNKL